MEYFIHDQTTKNKKTTYIELDLSKETFDPCLDSFIKGSIEFISGKKGVAHVHPKDQYSKKTGREVAKSKAVDTLFKITIANVDKHSAVLYIDDEQGVTYRIEKFKKTGNVILI